MSAYLEITQVRSAIGRRPEHRGTLRALGLKRIRHTVVHEDTPVIRGMVKKVAYLVEVRPATKKSRHG
jgi:large subunit ribosomal protein L30